MVDGRDASELGVSLPDGPVGLYLPEYLVPPYFFFKSTEDPFYRLTFALAKEVVEQKRSDEDLLAILVFDWPASETLGI